MRRMLDGTGGAFDGPHCRLEMMLNNPAPLHRVPIMIGGSGERKTLRLVARLADACNILVPEPGESRRKLEVLRRHCEEVGRDYQLILNLPDAHEPATLERLAKEVLAPVRD